MEQANRMSILVLSCDKNLDVLSHYVILFRKYWSNCCFPVYLVSETQSIESDYNSIVVGEKTTWTKEVLYAIDRTQGEYVLLLLDDAYLYTPIDNAVFQEIVDFMEQNHIKYYRVPHMKSRYPKEADYAGTKNVSRVYNNKAYGVSIGITIWDKNELRHLFGDGKRTAWQVENDFSKMAAETKTPGFIEGYVSDKRMLLPIAHMITMGKWIPSGIKTMKAHGYEISTTQRGMLSRLQELRMTVLVFCTRICPTRLRHPLKKALSCLGMKFVTQY